MNASRPRRMEMVKRDPTRYATGQCFLSYEVPPFIENFFFDFKNGNNSLATQDERYPANQGTNAGPVSCRCFRLREHNTPSETLAKHADRAEFHCPREFIAAARTGALGLRAHFTTRLSAAIQNEKNTMRIPSSGNLALQRLASCCPVARAIASSFTLASQITFRNRIPTVGAPAAFRSDNGPA
jgi:hypothetical protein